ncbi:MAG: hypothetical protein MK110_03510 [Fuerstiella sp.]|nr:hypothetical protein [Fuerstiella sp.]
MATERLLFRNQWSVRKKNVNIIAGVVTVAMNSVAVRQNGVTLYQERRGDSTTPYNQQRQMS